jgi:glycosyltransferase involved in cell wall biosynthesis
MYDGPGTTCTDQHLGVIADLRRQLRETRQMLEETTARLNAASQQEETRRAHLQWRWRQWLRKCVGVRLGVMEQYTPRPLQVPRHYTSGAQLTPVSISVVTPSFNQGNFLGRTIESVLGQQYGRLEYIVQDGLSADETPLVLKLYRPRLAHCESRKDGGQAHAINLGFEHATGEVMAYLNSDDLLLPGALHYVANYFASHPDVDVVYGHRIVIDENDNDIGRWVLPRHDNEVLSWADYVPQETLFWRRRIWDRVGGEMDESFQFALDWDLILRFRDAGARFVRLPRFLGAFRHHLQQKTCSQLATRGLTEMTRLRRRCHSKSVTFSEIAQHLSGYYLRHILHDRLYQLRLLRY